jgi:hypothetical protein
MPVLPTMMWSCTEMPGGVALSMIALVIWMCACEGVGSPEGWLRTMGRIMLIALALLPRMQGQGSLIGGGRWCLFVAILSGQSRSLGVLQRHGRSSNLL